MMAGAGVSVARRLPQILAKTPQELLAVVDDLLGDAP
jgi:hypothetical protein